MGRMIPSRPFGTVTNCCDVRRGRRYGGPALAAVRYALPAFAAAPRPMTTKPSKKLETFPNPNPERDYQIHMQVPEFTCLCPMTGQPDFAKFTIDYIADKKCVELKSLKLYMWSFREEGAFHERVTNAILDDLVKATAPRFMRVTSQWYVRGGIYTNVVVEHRKKGWKGSTPLAQFGAAQSIA